MTNVFLNSWACDKMYHFFDKPCSTHKDIKKLKRIIELEEELEILTLKYIVK
jgi:hypothetical protein